MRDERQGSTGPRNALLAAGPLDTAVPDLTGGLAEFVRRLEQGYERVLRADTEERNEREFRENLLAIKLARARIDKDDLARAHANLSPQIALLGPTQAGKSSIVNWLLGQHLAQVSPLAGYTIHPHGFCWGCSDQQAAAPLTRYLNELQRYAHENLPRDRIDVYTLTSVAAPAGPIVPAACLWDTPDFDSVDSEDYRGNLLRILGVADAIVLVLSKDKYSDQSVWDMVGLIEVLGQPAVIVLNKTDEPARQALVASLAEKWRASRSDAVPPIITLPFIDPDDGSQPLAALEQLAAAMQHRLLSIDRTKERLRTRKFLQAHWKPWMEPVHAEHAALAEWDLAITTAIEEALIHYQREYLEHPQHYETFQRALARLLTLLEIPGIAGAVSAARRVLTWPFRQASNLGKRLRGPSDENDTQSAEQTMLEQIAEHVMLSLDQVVLSKREAESPPVDWWKQVGLALRTGREDAKARFRAAHRQYAAGFQVEIDRTARALYERLEARPMVLNSLRATRITTDAAALAVALHTGGIGIQDFVIAPATLSLTSMLTESALGHYVNQAATELKRRQLAAVRTLFLDNVGGPLRGLPDRLSDAQRFDIPPSATAQAERLIASYA